MRVDRLIFQNVLASLGVLRASRLVLSSLERRDIVSTVIAGRVQGSDRSSKKGRRVFWGEGLMVPKKKWKVMKPEYRKYLYIRSNVLLE